MSPTELESVAEALWRHAGFGDFAGEKVFADRPEKIRRGYLDRATAAILALDAARSAGPRSTPAEPGEKQLGVAVTHGTYSTFETEGEAWEVSVNSQCGDFSWGVYSQEDEAQMWRDRLVGLVDVVFPAGAVDFGSAAPDLKRRGDALGYADQEGLGSAAPEEPREGAEEGERWTVRRDRTGTWRLLQTVGPLAALFAHADDDVAIEVMPVSEHEAALARKDTELEKLQEIVCSLSDAIHGTAYVGSNGLEDVHDAFRRVWEQFGETLTAAEMARRTAKSTPEES